MNSCSDASVPPDSPLPASAMKKRRNGTERPSLSPASTLSASRIFRGTRGLLTMICPSPASVGARMAARMPASQNVSWRKTTSAASAPSTSVRSMPGPSSRAGSARILERSPRSVRLASVKSRRTRPTSASARKVSAFPSCTPSSAVIQCTAAPAAVKRIGGVRIVRPTRAETRLKRKTSARNVAIRLMGQVGRRWREDDCQHDL